MFLPKDGQTNPIDVTIAMSKGARSRGAQIFEHTKVTGILTDGKRATGVSTAEGDIKAEFVVNCAGMWGREVGRMAGVNVPLQACEHFYIVTEEIEGLPADLPVLRDPGRLRLLQGGRRQDPAGRLREGGQALGHGRHPGGLLSFDELPEDFDHFDADPGGRHAPGAGAPGAAGIRKFFQRAGELHAG